MTEKLYNTDSYIREFEAVVVSCEPREDGKFMLVLDKTAFFPEEGGQNCDRGRINDEEVLEVILSGEEIIHVVSNNLEVGSKVKGNIDWEMRFSNMQMHSGEHIFSGIVNRLFGYSNVGFHLSPDSATMDYDGKLSKEDVCRVEKMANFVIWANKTVRVFFPSKEEIETLEFRAKPKGIVGDLRLVEIEDTDLCACCAPHVSKTGEIGLIKITSFENYKGGTRLNYLCGTRALEYYSELLNITDELGRILNSPKVKLCETADRLKTSLAEKEYAVVEIRRSALRDKIRKNKCGVIVMAQEDADLLKFAINELKTVHKGICAVFAGNDENGYRFIMENDESDLTETAEELRNKFNAKCGGKKGSIQGNIDSKIDEISRYFGENYQIMFE